MDTEKKKKKSKAKPTETLEENGSNAATDRSKGLLLSSIEAFLGSSGLNNTLAAFRSEAQLESNGLKVSAINLEELFCRILGISEDSEEVTVGWLKDLQKNAVSKSDGSENAHDASEENQKKKRKNRKKNGEGSNTMTNEHGSEKCNGELNGLADANDVKKPKSAEQLCSETKEKKKKKHKVDIDVCEEKAERKDSKKRQETVEELIGKLKTLTDTSTLPVESNAKHKGEKKKKAKVTSDPLVENGSGQTKDDSKESDPVTEKSSASVNEDNIEKKSQKKRKRVASEEKKLQGENKTITKELTDAGKNTESGTPEKLGMSLQENEQTPMGKKRKTEKRSDVHDVQKGSEMDQLPDDNVEKNRNEGGTASKSKKRENHSAEPKTVNAFQRVKIDEVKFADDRLQDNSYWALDDTGSGYGAKAQEVLGQVRGRDFRHEKTKKKRGSYRGGQIDQESKSIKFNYADED